MFKKFLLILSILSIDSTFVNLPAKVKSKPIKQNKVLLLDKEFILFNKLFTPEIQDKTSKIVVKSLSNTLPQFDSISHIVLNTNSRLISTVLENDVLPHQLKKDIILLTIKMTQEGDNMGGQILELYYHIVDKIL